MFGKIVGGLISIVALAVTIFFFGAGGKWFSEHFVWDVSHSVQQDLSADPAFKTLASTVASQGTVIVDLQKGQKTIIDETIPAVARNLATETAARTAAVAALDARVSELVGKYNQLVADVADVVAKLKALPTATANVATVNTGNGVTKDDVDAVKAELASLRTAFAGLNVSAATASDLSALDTRVQKLEAAVTNINTALTDHDNRLKVVEKPVAAAPNNHVGDLLLDCSPNQVKQLTKDHDGKLDWLATLSELALVKAVGDVCQLKSVSVGDGKVGGDDRAVRLPPVTDVPDNRDVQNVGMTREDEVELASIARRALGR